MLLVDWRLLMRLQKRLVVRHSTARRLSMNCGLLRLFSCARNSLEKVIGLFLFICGLKDFLLKTQPEVIHVFASVQD